MLEVDAPTGPGCHADAHRLLVRNGHPCAKVIAVDPDSILYLNSRGEPRTAWIRVQDTGRVRLRVQPGFVAERPGDFDEGEEGK